MTGLADGKVAGQVEQRHGGDPYCPTQRIEVAKGLFVTTGLDVGGAETMLFRLLSQLDRKKYAAEVVSLKGSGVIGERIQSLGIPVHTLAWKSSWSSLSALRNLIRLIRTSQPDFVQGWMYHGNMAAQAAHWALGRHVPVMWNIRHSLHETRLDKRSTIVLLRLLAGLSSRCRSIVYNSHTAARQHQRLGYDARRTVVIPNGFDCDLFRPRPECRGTMRAALGLPEEAALIGLIARLHPVKDHATFLQAAAKLTAGGSPAHFILVGAGTTNKEIAVQVDALGLGGRVHALGERADAPELTAGLDIAVSSSRSEAFSNTIGEAMSCGVPCVVTDVGDSAQLVGETGRVVAPGDAAALSGALRELLELSPERRRELGAAARNRILREYSLDRVVACYEKLYTEVVHGRRP